MTVYTDVGQVVTEEQYFAAQWEHEEEAGGAGGSASGQRLGHIQDYFGGS